MRTPEQVIVASIRFDHNLSGNARRIVDELRAEGYEIVRRPSAIVTLPIAGWEGFVQEVEERVQQLEASAGPVLPETNRIFGGGGDGLGDDDRRRLRRVELGLAGLLGA